MIWEMTNYGKSMYGGWYVNYITSDGNRDGEHFRTKAELKEWLYQYGEDINNLQRYDN